MVKDNKENTKEQILIFLKQQTNEINLKDISKQLNISYPTILKYCEIMLAEGKVEIRDYGNNRLIKTKEDNDAKNKTDNNPQTQQ